MSRNNEGKNVYVGSMFSVRVANSRSIDEIIDFTKDEEASLVFPSEVTVKKEVDVIEESLIGIPTSLKFLGKSQITGDINDITTPNGIIWYAANAFGGIVLSRKNEKALITIETDGRFIIEAKREDGKLVSVLLKHSVLDDVKIDISENTTVSDFVSRLNEHSGFHAVIHVGTGNEIFTLEKDFFSSSVIEHIFAGDLESEYKKTLAKYIYVITPKRGEPLWFNMLVGSDNAQMNCQYVGCRLLKLNINYANNSLTKVSSSIWASNAIEFNGVLAKSKLDDVKGAYSQTGGRTKVYVSGVEAKSISSITSNFEISVEPKYNISNEAYSIPVMKYSDSYDFEMIFNEESKSIFEKRVIENKNISLIIASETYSSGVKYQMIKYSKTLLGQPQYPSIADGVIAFQASGFTSVANSYDPYTSTVIVTGDVLLEANYDEDQMKKDFPEYAL